MWHLLASVESRALSPLWTEGRKEDHPWDAVTGQSWTRCIPAPLTVPCLDVSRRSRKAQRCCSPLCPWRAENRTGEQLPATPHMASAYSCWYSTHFLTPKQFTPLYLSFLETPQAYIKVSDTSTYKVCHEVEEDGKVANFGQRGDFGF